MDDSSDNENVFEVEKIIDVRLDEIGRSRLYRVRWKGCGSDDDTWEPKSNLLTCDELLQRFEEERSAKKERKKQKKKKKSQSKVDIPVVMVKAEPEDYSDFEDAKSKKNTRNPSTLANLTSPVSSNASSFDNDFDLSGMTRKQRQAYEKLMEESRLEAECANNSINNESLKRKSDAVATKKPTTKKNKARLASDSDSENLNNTIVKRKKKGVKKPVIDDSSETELSVLTTSKPSEILNEVFNKHTTSSVVRTPSTTGVTSQAGQVTPTKTVHLTKTTSQAKMLDSSKSTIPSPQVGKLCPVQTDEYVPLLDQLKSKTETTLLPMYPSPEKNQSIFNNSNSSKAKNMHSKQTESVNSIQSENLNLIQTENVNSTQIGKGDTALQAKPNKVNEKLKNLRALVKINSVLEKIPLSTQSNTLSGLPVTTNFADILKNSSSTVTNENLSKQLGLTEKNFMQSSEENTKSTTVSEKNVQNDQVDQGEKVNTVHFLVQNGSSGDIASKTEISKREKNNSHGIENISKQENRQETGSDGKLKNTSEIDITKLNKNDTDKQTNNHTLEELHTVKHTSTHKNKNNTSTYTQQSTQKKLTNDDSSLATTTQSVSSQSSNLSNKKTLHRSSSSPAVGTKDVSKKIQEKNLKDKSRKISVREYQAKQKKKNTPDEGGGIVLDFMKINTETAVPKLRTNSVDRATIIPSKKTVERVNSTDKPQEKARSVPQFSPSTNADVLGNILELIEMPVENEAEQNVNRDESNETGSQEENQSITESEEDIILEEDPDEDGDIDDDLDEYSGDEDGMLMYTEQASTRPSHLNIPGANSKVLDNLIVFQAILQGDYTTVIQCRMASNMIDQYVSEEETLLMKAVRECAPDMVQILLEKKADPNKAKTNGVTPLMVAVRYKQKGLVSLLIQNGAKLNLQTVNGETALIMACKAGYMEIVHVLLNSGADVKPALTYLEKNVAIPSHPQHLRPMLQHALNAHSERLREITETMLRALIDTPKLQLGPSLMSCRTLSPDELNEHDFYFKCDVNAAEPRINVLMLALPALFKKDGNITIDFDSIKYPVDEVYLNKEKAITVLPGNKSLYFLHPDFGGRVNILKIKTTCPNKVLVCVYALTFGKFDQASAARIVTHP
ncbi:M-phase phosphoprotein 8-like [Hydractinia symbiolongicarpus]|uniref:M-phase phosphoprotein 8-like n=1 Tax=Hydractinia symbiolongicarpus TaxID=13093 RepID=UPI00255110D1|nr:M-phase phosphoprotein 8-like [Hydractinia symbiolongicarpus]